MSFDLDSSSSSDIGAAIAPRKIIHEPASDDSSDVDQAIDDDLVQSIRNALHLSVGNICREQDAAASSNGADIDTGIDSPSFTMSNAAIAALTDLTYHYSTTLLANDLVSFSSHAGRKIIKPEDVLLMSRKDKNGIGADMKLKMKEISARNKGDKTKKAAKKTVGPRRKSNSDRSTSPVVRKRSSKTTGKTKSTKSKSKQGKNGRKTQKAPPVYSSSSSDSDEDLLASVVQKVAEIEKQKCAQKNCSDDLDDFIVNDNDYYNRDDESDDEVDFQLSAKKKKHVKSKSKSKTSTAQKSKKNALFNSSARNQDVFGGLSDSDSSDDVVSKPKYKSIDAHFSKSGQEGTTEDMAIDLGSD